MPSWILIWLHSVCLVTLVWPSTDRRLPGCLDDLLVGWLTVWVIDLLVEYLTVWLVKWLAVWLINSLFGFLSGWSLMCLVDLFNGEVSKVIGIGCLSFELVICLSDWPFNCQPVGLFNWVVCLISGRTYTSLTKTSSIVMRFYEALML